MWNVCLASQIQNVACEYEKLWGDLPKATPSLWGSGGGVNRIM